MATIEYIFAKDLKEGDILADPSPEIYTGAPGGAFVEHTKVIKVEHERLRGKALGMVRDPTPPAVSPEEVLYQIFPDAENIDTTTLAPAIEAIQNIQRWIPASHPEHEIPQIHVTTRRFGKRYDPIVPQDRLVNEDGSHVDSEMTTVIRWGIPVAVIRGNLDELLNNAGA